MSFVLTFPSVATFGVSGTCAVLIAFDTTITVDAVEGIFSGTLEARIYDSTSHALLASGPSTAVTGTSTPNRLPLSSSVVLTAGTTYMLGYYVVSSGTSGEDTSSSSVTAGGVTMSTPGGRVEYSSASDAYPTSSGSTFRWPVGVEATVGGGGSPATASGSLSLSGSATGVGAATASAALSLAGSVATSAPAAASGSPILTGSATATAPFSVTATPSGANVLLSWPSRAGSGYVIERDGADIAFGITGTSYTDTPGSGSHTYRVGVLT